MARLRSWRRQGRGQKCQLLSKLSLASRLLWSLMRGATASDWLNLLHFNALRDCVYIYNAEKQTVHKPGSAEIEWPIIWVLARFNKKFAWSLRLPPATWIQQDLAVWRCKMAWRWFFRHRPGGMLPFRPCRDIKPQPYTAQLPSSLRTWLTEVQRRILCRLQHDIRRGNSFKNTVPLTAFGLQRLKHSGLAVLPTDKDGGFGVVAKDQLVGLHKRIFNGNAYIACVLTEQDRIRMMWRYESICKEVSTVMGARGAYVSQLMKAARRRGARITSSLGVTIKSHKPQGQVKCRNLHRSRDFAFEGLTAWIDYVLKPILLSMPHMLANSEAFVKAVGGVKLSGNSVLVRIDVEEFFMSGSVEQLLNSTSNLVPHNVKGVYMTALRFLLSHQYVVSDLLPDEVHRVILGTGMGMRHSGSVADASFYHQAEARFIYNKRGVWAIDYDFLKRWGVSHYFRFKDDLFLVADSEMQAWDFFAYLQKHSEHFTLKMEEVSSSQVTMLDVDVFVVEGHVHVKPHFKKTSLMRPLESASAHALGVHHWPLARLKALSQLSSRTCDARLAHEAFIRRFEAFFAPSDLVAKLRQVASWLQQNHSLNRNHTTIKNSEKKHKRFDAVWLPLSFHPVWDTRALSKLMGTLNGDPALKHMLECAFQGGFTPGALRVSWRNAILPAVNRVMRYNKPDGR